MTSTTSPNQDKALLALRERIRHSAAHIMADAILQLFPRARLGIGPPTAEGFYYDIEAPRPFTPEDLQELETRMRETIDQNLPFVQEHISRDTANHLFAEQPYKLDLIEGISTDESLSLYRHGEFVDLCQGPHVQSTKEVTVFKLLSIAGAYWRGDERRPMLQRIYGTAFENQEALDKFLEDIKEAERRDHRKLGRELGLFNTDDDVGPGLIIWHPKGARLRTKIENLWRDVHEKAGYDLVYSPHLGRAKLWETSGHLEFYAASMYAPIDVDGQAYYIKPMNCPFHIKIYQSNLRSYRELPLRLAELGTVYRYERSGVLHGLMRVRGFTQDDAHIFCRPDQVEQEILDVLDMTVDLLSMFGFSEWEVALSTQPEKSVGELALWQHATQALERALQLREFPYVLDPGGGAFYGPKIDLKIRDALGRWWQCTTIQFDFNLPERFDLSYQGSDGHPHRPYMIHRAVLGSIERFIGVLLEHYGGAFPLWLSPLQVIIVPIADRHLENANQVAEEMKIRGIEVVVDWRRERMNLKIRQAQMQKIPYTLVIGDEELKHGTVSVRHRSSQQADRSTVTEFIEMLTEQIQQKL